MQSREFLAEMLNAQLMQQVDGGFDILVRPIMGPPGNAELLVHVI
jgi:hypothetical protein